MLKRNICLFFSLSTLLFSAANAASTCSGTEVSSCGAYTSQSTCSSNYYVYFENHCGVGCNEAAYCVWSNNSCVDGGSLITCNA